MLETVELASCDTFKDELSDKFKLYTKAKYFCWIKASIYEAYMLYSKVVELTNFKFIASLHISILLTMDFLKRNHIYPLKEPGE